jgi:hypothetical protein
MAKRFTDTEIWSEDWFLEMPSEYKLFWYYMLSECDHAGFFKINLRTFCSLNEVSVTSETALLHFNKGKDRIRQISSSIWLIEDFFVFQYGRIFNINNPLHKGISKQFEKFEVKLTSIRGVADFILEVKEKVKDKDNNVVKTENQKNGKFSGNFKSRDEEYWAERASD